MSEPTNSSLVTSVIQGAKPDLVHKDLPIPVPGPRQILVKVSHAAQNPTDVKSFDRNAFGDGAVLGCDFVGDVVEVAKGVGEVEKGDVVAGFIRGGEIKELGAFTTYTLAEEGLSFKLPTGVSREDASTVPLAATTAWLALFSKRCLGLDRSRERGGSGSVLIWGGGSSVGSYAIQLASIYGFNVVTTCSPRHSDLARSYGAKEVFDYRDENVAEKIRAAVPDVQYVFDTIGGLTSSVVASRALSVSEPSHGRLCTVRPDKANTDGVASGTYVTDVMVWTAFLRDYHFVVEGGEFYWPASKEDHNLARELFANVPKWLASGTFKTSTPKVFEGLGSVIQGFQEQRENRISGYKIVYRV